MPNQERLYQNILNEEPCSQVDKFIISKAYELRHTVERHSKLLEQYTQRKVRIPIEWVDKDRRFGPYERFILHAIFDRNRNPMIFRSGTGSGKSSLFAFVAAMYEQAAKKEHSQRFHDAPSIGEFTTIYDLNTASDPDEAEYEGEKRRE